MAFDLTATLRLNDANFTSGMRKATLSMGGLKSGAGEVVKTLGLITGVAGAVGVAFASTKKAMDFESEMSTIQALTGSTNAQMKDMSKLALDMGAKTKYSALEAGQGIEELLKAGLTPATVKAGGLEAALNLATAGGIGLADSAEIMSTALNSFRSDGMKAADAANILAGTANASATDVMDLKYSLSMVSAVASGVGLSFKDTNAALGVMANNGLKGSDAGTSLKTMLSNLEPRTKKATAAFMDLGIMTKKGNNAFYDSHGKIKSMAEIAGILNKSLKDLTPQQRQSYLYTMFGSDAIRAANVLYKEGAKGINDFNKEMSHVTALDVAKQKMNNAAGAVEQFKGALETLQISVLLPLMPVIKDGANALANWVSNLKPATIKQWGDNIKTAGQAVLSFAGFIAKNWSGISTVVLGIAAGMATLKIGMTGLMIISTITKLIQAWRAATLAATLAELGLNAAMLLNPWTWVIAGIALLVAAGVMLYKNWNTVEAVWTTVWNGIKSAAESSINFVISKINDLIGIINRIPGVNIPLVPKVDFGAGQRAADAILSASGSHKGSVSRSGSFTNASGGHQLSSFAGGLDRVPYNGFPANLHKDEMVLTSQQAKDYRNGQSNGGVTISGGIHLYGVGGDLEGAADQLLAHVVRKWKQIGS
jgi:TP901 family phage tail tape measure protein